VAEERNRSYVTALARGIAVLTAFGPDAVWLGNAELALRVGLPKTTVSRITSTLTQLGYLRYSGSRRQYRLGPGVLTLGYSALADLDIRKLARRAMQEIADEFPGVVGLFARDGFQVMQLESCHGATGVLSFRLDEKGGAPLVDTAFGQALLWAVPQEERAGVVVQLERLPASGSPSVRQTLNHAFSALERDGFCMTYGRWQRDVNTVGVPLAPRHFAQPLALGFACLVGHPARAVLQARIAPRLLAAAASITRALEKF
jgi:DNA-binding IclR family transcriptional regulator